MVLVLAAVGMGGDGPPAAARIRRSREFLLRVRRAVDRGAAWLRLVQSQDGSFPDSGAMDTTAPAYRTMRACGVARDDPAAARAWQALRQAAGRGAFFDTYAAATFLQAAAAHGEKAADAVDDRVRLSDEDAASAAETAGRLASGQLENGGWAVFLRPQENGSLRAPYDMPSASYALLGLDAAARCGVRVDPTAWKRALGLLLAAQEGTGAIVRRGVESAEPVLDRALGWGYGPSVSRLSAACSFTTACGVGSVAVCRGELMLAHESTKKLDADSERSRGTASRGSGSAGPSRCPPTSRPARPTSGACASSALWSAQATWPASSAWAVSTGTASAPRRFSRRRRRTVAGDVSTSRRRSSSLGPPTSCPTPAARCSS